VGPRSDKWEHQSRVFGPMLPCAASGEAGEVAAPPATVGYNATRRHQVNGRRAAAVLRNRPASIWQSPTGPMRKPTRGHPETKMRPPMREGRQSGCMPALQLAAALGKDTASFGDGVLYCGRSMRAAKRRGLVRPCERTRPQVQQAWRWLACTSPATQPSNQDQVVARTGSC
jgi:hypothetical protein